MWWVVGVVGCGCGGLTYRCGGDGEKPEPKTKLHVVCVSLLCSGCVVLSASAFSCRLSTARRIGDVPALYSGLWHQRSAFISPSRCRVCHGPGYVIFAMPFPPLAPIALRRFPFPISNFCRTASPTATAETTTLLFHLVVVV